MNTESAAYRRAEVADEISKWTVGWGMVVMVLFPLSIPILALTAIALLPLLVPVIALGVLAGVVYLPVKLVRSLRGRRTPLGHPDAADEEVLRPVEVATLHR